MILFCASSGAVSEAKGVRSINGGKTSSEVAEALIVHMCGDEGAAVYHGIYFLVVEPRDRSWYLYAV